MPQMIKAVVIMPENVRKEIIIALNVMPKANYAKNVKKVIFQMVMEVVPIQIIVIYHTKENASYAMKVIF